MSKPQPYWASFKQPPRSMKHHGQNRRASPPSHRNSSYRASDSSGGSDAGDAIAVSWNTGWLTLNSWPEPAKPPAIPYAGIRTGEIIGHRLWRVFPDAQLRSLAHDRTWQPGEVVSGDVNERIMAFLFSVWGGVYAFASPDSLAPEVADYQEHWGHIRHQAKVLGLPKDFLGIAAGTVKMWGDVIEHESGYRAQFAKIESIDAVFGDGDLAELRRKYLAT